MTEHFDAIVVGSGFGGSVMTYRLAAAGLSVCLLERGASYPPGSFPRSPYRMRRAFWDPSEGCFGMFSVWSFRHFGAIMSSGLGGGSLIYANVLLPKDEQWFARDASEYWPITLEDLRGHYVAAERMLGAQPYPIERSPYRETPRTQAFIAAAERLGWHAFAPPLGVTFAPEGHVPGDPIPGQPGNLHHAVRSTCRLVGECDIGCNYGAKNSLDYTYLSRAADKRASIRPLHEVRRFEQLADGRFCVHYVVHDPADERPKPTHEAVLEPKTMTGTRLVLAAGSLGSTYLLLRNRAAFPRLSSRLGARFSGNGDLLTLALRPTTTVAGRPIPTPIESGRGPAITMAVRFPDRLDGGTGRGFYLEDAGYPDLLNWLLQTGVMPGALWRWRHTGLRLLRQALARRPERDLSAEIAALLGDDSLTSSILPLLGMGRDVPGGRMYLADGRLDINWRLDRSRPYFQRVRSEMQRFANALGADFADNPIWHFGNRVVTVHPLGGVPMGRDSGEGVVDSWGRVFGYDGLYVADGSIMPGAVGPNPSLTIAAMAERIADGLLDRAVRGLP